MKLLLLLSILFVSANAVANKVKISQNLVAGIIGCPADSIGISNFSSSSKNPLIASAYTFTATCDDAKYHCSYLYPSPATCKLDAKHVAKTEEDRAEEDKKLEEWKVNVLNQTILNWKKPASIDGMIDSEMSVKVDNNGKLLNLRWVEDTGNKKINRSIVNAFKDASPFPRPPVTAPTLTVTIIFPAQK
jgi:TonB family protein